MSDLRQSTSQIIRFGPFLDSTDGVTPETALTITQADMQLSKDGAGFGYYRKALPIWRGNHAPYVMKSDDVFLESALFCSRLLTVSKQTARQKHPKAPARAESTPSRPPPVGGSGRSASSGPHRSGRSVVWYL